MLRPLRACKAAFTLVELIVSMSLMGVVGSIIYAVATETLISFARNVGINKSYTDARMSLDRIGSAIQSATQNPVLVNTSGIAAASPAAGVLFYRYGTAPNYAISGNIDVNSITLTLQGATGQPAPKVGDVVTVGGIGFQGLISSVDISGSNYTLKFAGDKLLKHCNNSDTNASPVDATVASSCRVALLFNQVSFIVVNQQLRYYPVAKIKGVDADFDTATSFKVIATLPANGVVTPSQNGLPFATGAKIGMIAVTLCVETPDYSNRKQTTQLSGNTVMVNAGGFNQVGAFSTYTQMQASFTPRSPILIR